MWPVLTRMMSPSLTSTFCFSAASFSHALVTPSPRGSVSFLFTLATSRSTPLPTIFSRELNMPFFLAPVLLTSDAFQPLYITSLWMM